MKSSRRPKPTPHRAPEAPPPLATRTPRLRGLALGAAALALGLSATTARAEDSAGAQATRIVAELSVKTSERTLLGPWLERAKHALERAGNARRAGDHRHGSELEALALELAQSAVDLQREKQAQARVSETEEKALAAETRVVRARALVEQTAARRGRAAERLQELEAEKAKPGAGALAPGKAAPETKKAAASGAADAKKASTRSAAPDAKKAPPSATPKTPADAAKATKPNPVAP